MARWPDAYTELVLSLSVLASFIQTDKWLHKRKHNAKSYTFVAIRWQLAHESQLKNVERLFIGCRLSRIRYEFERTDSKREATRSDETQDKFIFFVIAIVRFFYLFSDSLHISALLGIPNI